MNIYLNEIRPSHNGERVELKLRMEEQNNFNNVKMIIATEFFSSLGISLNISDPISISKEKYTQIEYYDRLTVAINAIFNLLSYAQNNGASLKRKLQLKGIEKDIANDAVEYVIDKGYINEYDQANMIFETSYSKKLYGKNRIRNDLYKKGFKKETIDKVLSQNVNYEKYCAKRIIKMGGKTIFSEKEEREKYIASLLRYGYTITEIKNAIKTL